MLLGTLAPYEPADAMMRQARAALAPAGAHQEIDIPSAEDGRRGPNPTPKILNFPTPNAAFDERKGRS
jgi:hypothetical protein